MPAIDFDAAEKVVLNISKKCDLGPELSKQFYNAVFANAKDKVINKVINLISTYLPAIKEFSSIVNIADFDIGSKYEAQEKPLIICHPTDILQVRIFPNIIISATSIYELENINIFDSGAVLSSFIASYKKDMEDSQAKNKWEPLERADVRLGLYVDMPVSRMLTRYTNLTKEIGEAALLAFAIKIDNIRKPLELLFGETPEDFTTMYDSGPSSCMASSHASAWPALTKVGLCPPSFYAWFPYTKGAYITKGGKIVARVILFRDLKEINKWYYGTLYSSSSEYTTKFLEALKAAGIADLKTYTIALDNKAKYSPPEDTTFKIPGVKSEGNYLCPWPYFDNMEYYGKGFYATFDTVSKEFTITYKKVANKGAISSSSTGGTLNSKDYITRECAHCKNTSTNTWITSEEGGMYCSTDCAKAAGFVSIKTKANTKWARPTEELIRAVDGTYFSTLEAAKYHNYYMEIKDDHIFPEDGEELILFSQHKCVYDMEGRTYVLCDNEPFINCGLITVNEIIYSKNVDFIYPETA